MPIAAPLGTLVSLIAMEHEIVMQIDFLMAHKMALMGMARTFLEMENDYDPKSRAARELKTQVRYLKDAEKATDIKVAELQKKQQFIERGKEAVSRVVDKGIEQAVPRGNA